MITQEEVRRLFDYDAESGELIRKVTRNSNALAGDKIGCLNRSGYLVAMVSNRLHYVHRLIWLWAHGYLPENDIDHINRNPADNRLDNLREVGRSCNRKNSNIGNNNTSGVTGVGWSKRNNKWVVQILVNNRSPYLGLHQDFTEAVLTRLAAEQCLNWEGCDSSSTAYQYYLREIKR